MFGIEYLIYLYMIVSVAMAFFDFFFVIYERGRTWWFNRMKERMSVYLAHEIETNAEFPTKEHMNKLVKQMSHLRGLESFDHTMGHFTERTPELCQIYLVGISSVFDRLARIFAGKDELHKAYFAYIVKRWYRRRPASDQVVGALLAYTRSSALYERENGIEALAAVGSARQLVDGMVNLESIAFFHHPKLVTEAAMAFAGDPAELAEEFSARLEGFSPNLQAAAINFLRMKGHGDSRCMAELLEDPDTDPEVRIACIRYFMRRPDRRVVHTLRRIALSDDPGLWEQSAVATAALGSYIDRPTVATLVRCLSSPVWFVRFNAAKSLYDAGLSLTGRYLRPVMESGDRYARDMLVYRWAIEQQGRLRGTEQVLRSFHPTFEEKVVEYQEAIAVNGEEAADELPTKEVA